MCTKQEALHRLFHDPYVDEQIALAAPKTDGVTWEETERILVGSRVVSRFVPMDESGSRIGERIYAEVYAPLAEGGTYARVLFSEEIQVTDDQLQRLNIQLLKRAEAVIQEWEKAKSAAAKAQEELRRLREELGD